MSTASRPAPRPASPRTWSWGEAAVPIALLALGVFTLADAATIAVPDSANAVGPRAFPIAVGILLVGAAVALGIALVRGHGGTAEESEDVDSTAGTDWVTVAKLVGAFLALLVLVTPLGWLIAATVLFTGTAWALGARPIWRILFVGVVLNVAIQILFTQVLGLYLPAGPLGGVSFLG